MNKRLKKMLNGFALGDGYISKKKNSYTLFITHCLKQKDYLESKARILSEIRGKNVYIMNFNNGGYDAFRISISNSYLKFVYKWLYPEGKKTISLSFLRRMSDEAVCIWYMDDGSLYPKKRNNKIHSYELVFSTYCSEEEANNCITFFKERFDVNFTLKRNKGLFCIRCGTKEAKKLLVFLKPYCAKGMEYKFF